MAQFQDRAHNVAVLICIHRIKKNCLVEKRTALSYTCLKSGDESANRCFMRNTTDRLAALENIKIFIYHGISCYILCMLIQYFVDIFNNLSYIKCRYRIKCHRHIRWKIISKPLCEYTRLRARGNRCQSGFHREKHDFPEVSHRLRPKRRNFLPTSRLPSISFHPTCSIFRLSSRAERRAKSCDSILEKDAAARPISHG